MISLFAIVVLILLVAVPAFRAVAGCLAVGAIVLVVIVLIYVKVDLSQQEATAAAAKRVIQHHQLQFENVTLGHSYSSFDLKGKLTNTSAATVTEFEYRVSVCDPASAPGQCTVVADRTESVYLEVPPGQARYFDEMVIFTPDPHVPAGWTWRGGLVSVSGKR